MSNPYHKMQQQQQNSNGRMYKTAANQSQVQQQVLRAKAGANSVHGKLPMLMANNDVFSIGPYKARKDRSRVSVLQKYEIIGYIAAGTYGKVYKAKRRTAESNGGSNVVEALSAGNVAAGTGTPSQAYTGNRYQADEIATTSNQMDFSDPRAPKDINTRVNLLPEPDHLQQKEQEQKLTPQTETRQQKQAGVSRSDHKQDPNFTFYAIKKFKTEREGFEQPHYTGISQSACREMSLCRELDNRYLTKLVEIFMEKKSIYMVYEYAEHDLLQIIHYHSHPEKRTIPQRMIRSIIWQILDGVSFLHQNWVLHRDLKPANIMVTGNGCVKIGDLGLARKFHNMPQTLYTGDKVVVTIWYRAPELMLGARHYTPAIDLWAVGCIFAELVGLQPIFKGEEAKMDSKKSVPFQANQLQRILEVLGTPDQKSWPNIHKYSEYEQLLKFPKYRDNLPVWYHSAGGRDKDALDLLYKLLKYDPTTRIDAIKALDHEYFTNSGYPVSNNVFEGLNYKYPARRIHTSDNDILNIGSHKGRITTQQQQLQQQQSATANNTASTALGGLGVNRRILAAAAAAAAAVSNNNINSQTGGSRKSESARKRRR